MALGNKVCLLMKAFATVDAADRPDSQARWDAFLQYSSTKLWINVTRCQIIIKLDAVNLQIAWISLNGSPPRAKTSISFETSRP